MGAKFSKSGHASKYKVKNKKRQLKEDDAVRLTWEVSTDNVVRSGPSKQCEIPEQSLGQFIYDKISKLGDRVCVFSMETGWSYTYREIREHSKRVASSLIKAGLRSGDNVCLYCVNQPEFLMVLLAVILAGGTISLCHPSYEKLKERLVACRTKFLITSLECAKKAKEACSQLPMIKTTYVFGHFEDLTPFTHLVADDGNMFILHVSDDVQNEPVFIMHSDGSSHPPEPVLLTHYNVVANLTQFSQHNELSLDSRSDVCLAASTFCDSFGIIVCLLNCLIQGCRIVTVSSLNPEKLLEATSIHRVTVLPMDSSTLNCIMAKVKINNRDTSSIRRLLIKYNPRDADKLIKLHDMLPNVERHLVYSSAEITSISLINSDSSNNLDVGSPLCFTECKVVDTVTGKALNHSETGELCIRGPQIMAGYMNDPKSTMASIDDTGWYHTGDLAHRTEEGKFCVTEQKNELLSLKDKQLSLVKIELALESHSSVEDAVLIEIINDDGTEELVPHVTLTGNEHVSSRKENDILTHVYKMIGVKFSELKVVSEIPKTISGVVSRHQCRKQFGRSSDNLRGKTVVDENKNQEFKISKSYPDTKTDAYVENKIVINSLDGIEIPNIAFGEFMLQRLTKYGDQRCIISAESEKSLSFREVIDLSRRVGSGLIRRGFEPGKILCTYASNQPEFLVAILAVTMIGGRVSLCNPTYTVEELSEQLSDSSSEYLLSDATCIEKALSASKGNTSIKEVYVFSCSQSDATPFSSLIDDDGSMFKMHTDVNPEEDWLFLLYSSGTSGLPNGVMITHSGLISNLIQMEAKKTFPTDENDVCIAVLPFYHIYGLVLVLLHNIINGATLVTMSKFSPDLFIESLAKYNITVAPLVPFLVKFLFQTPLLDKHKNYGLKKIICGGASMNMKHVNVLRSRLPNVSIHQGYGMTESSGVATFNKYEIDSDSVGMPIPGIMVKVISTNEESRLLDAEEDGEICLKCQHVMKGYLNNDEATRGIIDKDGWLHTGDIGHYDRNGMIYFVDRRKELIKYKSLQISPSEIEYVLLSHPAIRDCSVIGLPDNESGELPLAFIVFKPGMENTRLDIINSFVSEKVAPHKRLRGGIKVIDEIPRSASGKILRRKLKEILEELLKPTFPVADVADSAMKYTFEIDKNVLKYPWDTSNIPDVSFAQFIMKKLELHGNKTCIVSAETELELTYSDVISRTKSVCGGLIRRGLKHGDTVCLSSKNHPDFLVTIIAVACAGAKLTLCNPAYTTAEISHLINHSEASYVICNEELALNIEVALKSCREMKDVVVFGNYGDYTPYSDLLADCGSRFQIYDGIRPRDDVLFLPYSSGTTGLPKAVKLSHYNIVANICQLCVETVFPLSQKDVTLALLPFFHIYGLVFILLNTVVNGGSVVCMSKFSPEVFVKAMEEYGVTMLPLVPFLVVFLSQTEFLDKYDLSSLKRIICGAAPLSDKQVVQLKQKMPNVMLNQGYGMTELSPVAMFETYGLDTASVGALLPATEAKIVDVDTNEAVSEGKMGELLIRGPQVMLGYFNNKEATAETIDEDGWLHTGDIAYWTRQGLFYIVDRKKELIKYRGMQISPSELESVIFKHPAVKDVGVVGLPDETSGEIPLAFVVCRSNKKLTSTELEEYVAGKVAPYKKLRGGVRFIKEIPRNSPGKILRRKLKALMMETMVENQLERSINAENKVLESPKGFASDESGQIQSPYDVEIVNNIVCNKLSFGDIPLITLGDFMVKKLSKYEEKVCIISAESGVCLTFKEVVTIAKSVGSGLRNKGFQPGQTLFLCCPNCPEFLTAVLGVIMIGGCVTLCNTVYTAHEMKHQLKHSKASWVIVHSIAAETAHKAIRHNKHIKGIFVIGEHEKMTPYYTLTTSDENSFVLYSRIKPETDVAFLAYSSGTTGPPKGVMLTHGNIVANILQLTDKDCMPVYADRNDVCLSSLPFFHMYSLLILLHRICNGGTVVTMMKFKPELLLNSIEKYEVTTLPLVPFLIVFLTNYPLLSNYNLKKLQRIICGAAPLSDQQSLDLKKILPDVIISQGFSMTELSPIACYDTYECDAASAGAPIPGTECKVIDPDTGDALEEGTPGELLVRGPQVMRGYYNNENATRNTVDQYGWLHTGDIAYWTTAGLIYIVDRKKELIKYRGMQISPSELESVLLKHSSVHDAGVIGIPDEVSGEVPIAFVVLKPDAKIDEHELESYVSNQVAPYKKLRGGVKIIDRIPRSAAGKILRRKLKEIIYPVTDEVRPEEHSHSSQSITHKSSRPAYIMVKGNVVTNTRHLMYPDVSFGEFYLSCIAKHGSSICIQDSSSLEKKYTFDQIVELSKKVSSGLKRRGFEFNDTLCIYASNCPEILITIISTSLCGGRIYLCHPENKVKEMTQRLLSMNVSYIVTSSNRLDIIQQVAKTVSSVKDVYVIDATDNSHASFDDLLTDDGSMFSIPSEIMPKRDILLLLESTSMDEIGTVRVKYTHYNIISNLVQLTLTNGTADVKKQSEIHLSSCDFSNGTSVMTSLLLPTINGETVQTLGDTKDNEHVIDVVCKNEISDLYLRPGLASHLLDSPLAKGFDSLKTLRWNVNPTMSQDVVDSLKTRLPHVNFQRFHAVPEGSVSFCSNDKSLSLLGLPLPGTKYQIFCRRTGLALVDGIIGELCIRGPQVMLSKATDPYHDGWLHTGHQCRWTKDGNVVYASNQRLIILNDGTEVLPPELEEALYEHRMIADVAITGVADKQHGQIPTALVVLEKRYELDETTESEIKQYVERRLAPHKQLAGGVKFVVSIPRDEDGVIIRHTLKEII